ncbi:MAG: biotin/lipoyl-binding protein [Candidatus Rokuibacteriota bacterium]
MDQAPHDPLLLRLLGRLLGILIVLGAVVLSVYAYRLNFVHPRTDDAAVRANVIGIAPHVGGPLVELRVVDNQRVRQGDLLFVIDPRPYEARLARARADLALTLKDVEAQQKAIASATAQVAGREAALAAATAEVARSETRPPAAEAEIARAEAEHAAAEASVTRLEAELAYAADYLRRVEPLLERQFVTADRVSDARSKRDAAAAAVSEARRRVRAAEAAVREARTRRAAADAAVDHAKAARRQAAHAIEQAVHDRQRAQELLAQFGEFNARLQASEAAVRSAELDVGYCWVRAPFDAYVTNLNIAVGEYAKQGQQVFALVDNRVWYVLANFRETYMASIQPGMQAEVYLLTYPGRPFRGVVQGIGWANQPDDGATVGVLPEVRRTLNWVRLANRFPVRIVLEERDPERPFRMGTTAVVTIRGFPVATPLPPARP